MKIYTKGGDEGKTALVGGERVPKYDPRVEAYGTVDELSAQIAMLKDMLVGEGLSEFNDDLIVILRELMGVEALLAVGKGGEDKVKDISGEAIEWLEGRIDRITEQLRPIDKFTILGGHVIVSQSHICRTVCRRAERRAIQAAAQYTQSTSALIYLNRLSDYLYTISRRLTELLDAEEILWIP